MLCDVGIADQQKQENKVGRVSYRIFFLGALARAHNEEARGVSIL